MNDTPEPPVSFGDDNPDLNNQVALPEWAQLQSKAGTFGFFSGLLVLGFVALTLFALMTGNWFFAGAGTIVLVCAIGLYLAAQLLHIRAILSKPSEPPAPPKALP